MNIGDVVRVVVSEHSSLVDRIGVIIDCIEYNDGWENYEVSFGDTVEWISDIQLVVLSEYEMNSARASDP